MHFLRHRWTRLLLLLWIFPALVWIIPQFDKALADGDNDFVPGEVVVKLKSTTDLPGVAAQFGLAPTPLDQFGSRPIYRLKITDSVPVTQKVSQLLADPLLRVVYAEPNYIFNPPEASRPSWNIGDAYSIGGDLNTYKSQWATGTIRLSVAQNVTRGAGVTVAVLDTGVDLTHPALAGHLVQGYDFVDMDADPSEVGSLAQGPYGHGTHVAGLIALVAPEAKIMPVRVLDPNGVGNIWVLAEALAYAADPDGNPATDDGADIINLSLGTTRRTELLSGILKKVCSDVPVAGDDDFPSVGNPNIVVIAAAGNTGDTTQIYPGAENTNGLLAVAASTQADTLATFSTSGSWIRVVAPGDMILSTVPGGKYGTWRGTSMAAPLVAGEAALVRAAFPGLKQAKVVSQIVSTGARIGGPIQSRIDAGKALTSQPEIESPTPTPTPVATPTPVITPTPTPLSTEMQAEVKTWTQAGTTYAHVKLVFPDASYRVVDWGVVTGAGGGYSVNAVTDKLSGSTVQAVTTAVNIFTLGALQPGSYSFTFSTGSATLKTQNFTVTTTTTQNQIDTQATFISQQYRDFLGREPDAPGLAFWTDNITKCSDPARRPAGQSIEQCIDRQRTTTSAAFFMSPEFQTTGYFVYRLYRGALGRAPYLSEFSADQHLVGAGIIQNDQLSGAVIEQNKSSFALQFANRPEFHALYDGLSNEAFLDKLVENTGVALTQAERIELIGALNNGTVSSDPSIARAWALQQVLDGIRVISEGNQVVNTRYGKAFYDKAFNEAFVLMEYFGYMRRDPDAPGYQFWLGKLNQYGNYIDAEMVRSFIVSPEYRARFGQP